LIDRFKNSIPKVIKKLQDKKYTIEDIKKGYNIRGYIVIVIRYIKAAEIDKLY
jgi:hypothetical protein